MNFNIKRIIVLLCCLNFLFVAYVDVRSYQHTNLEPRCRPYSENGIIEAKEQKIIYYKTHKTGSTTLGNIFFRFGVSNGLRFHKGKLHVSNIHADIAANRTYPEADIALYHHDPVHFKSMMKYYNSFIPNGKFVTVLREPISRYLSAYHYFGVPENISFASFSAKQKQPLAHYMSKDLGIQTDAELNDFFETAYDKFFFLVVEYFDESLVLLKRAWNWSLTDILYLKLNEQCPTVPLANLPPCYPKKSDLSTTELALVKANTALDSKIYERALKDVKAMLASQPQDYWDEVQQYKLMLTELKEFCWTNRTVCQAFKWYDMKYERSINQDGHVYGLPVLKFNM